MCFSYHPLREYIFYTAHSDMHPPLRLPRLGRARQKGSHQNSIINVIDTKIAPVTGVTDCCSSPPLQSCQPSKRLYLAVTLQELDFRWAGCVLDIFNMCLVRTGGL